MACQVTGTESLLMSVKVTWQMNSQIARLKPLIISKNRECAAMKRKESSPDPFEELETPTTPTDAMYVSDSDDEILTLKFECKVVMISGRTLGPFECDEATSVGWMRSKIKIELEELYNKGELDFVDFHLMRDGSVRCLRNDGTKIHKLVNIDDAVLNIDKVVNIDDA